MKKHSSNHKIIFIDPGYLEHIGHYETYASSLRGEAIRRGLDFEHYVSLSVSTSESERRGLHRWFLCTTFLEENLDDHIYLDYYTSSFAGKLNELIRSEAVNDIEIAQGRKRLILYMYTGHPRLIPVVAEVLNQEQYKKVNITFNYNIFYVSNTFALKGVHKTPYRILLNDISNELRNKDKKYCINLFSDSNRTINVYQKYFDRKIRLLPIPFAASSTRPKAEDEKNGITRIGFFGYTLRKQGFHYIRQLYEDIILSGKYSNLELVVRHQLFNMDASVLDDLRFLASHKERIHNIVGTLIQEDYYREIDGCDVVLIPHSRRDYLLQSSGTFIDAVSRGKVVVIPQNTWMSDQVMNYNRAVCYDGESYDSFRSAVIQALELIKDSESFSIEQVQAFQRFHSSENLISLLIDRGHEIQNKYEIRNSNKGDSIFLLSLDLLNDIENSQIVFHKKESLNQNIGWHYSLDFIWLLQNLQGLPKGSLILDAGAGNGLFQYILVDLGYKVISVDLINRYPPDPSLRTSSINHGERFQSSYLNHLARHYKKISLVPGEEGICLSSKEEFLAFLNESTDQVLYYQSNIASMQLIPDNFIDAVVSISAIEHNEKGVAKQSVTECLRVMKPGALMLMTTSSSFNGDIYHEPSQGWCFSEETLKEIFNLHDTYVSNFNEFEVIMRDLSKPGNELQLQLSDFYYKSGFNGMPWGNWNPQYCPVGIRRYK